jgi:hypothetical protein
MRHGLAFLTLLLACGDNIQPGTIPELSPSEGFSIRTPEFDVAQGTEVQNCYFFDVPDLAQGADIWIDHIKLALATGSHHMTVFRVKTIVNLDPAAGAPIDLGSVQGTVIYGADNPECWKSSNWADWPLVTNSQQSAPDQQVLDWHLPTGVAERFHPGEKLMLQVHFVNSTDQQTPFPARGDINFYRSTDGDSIELGTMFATDQNIRVCQSNPTVSFAKTCTMPPGPHTIVGANGHFHSRGTEFRIWTWDSISTTQPDDAQLFYDSHDWSEPVIKLGMNQPMPDPGGIWWRCDFQWSPPTAGCDAVNARDPLHANDCCYTFGPIVETSEHCNVFLYYYPLDTRPITCL